MAEGSAREFHGLNANKQIDRDVRGMKLDFSWFLGDRESSIRQGDSSFLAGGDRENTLNETLGGNGRQTNSRTHQDGC